MSNIFQGTLVRLRAGEASEEAIFRNWTREEPDSGRLMYEISFPVANVDAQSSTGEEKAQDGDNFAFTIETLNGEIAGAIHVHHCNQRCGTFMYGIGIFPEHRRKGYAYEAIWLVLSYYFFERRYQKCTAEVYSFNKASIQLHEQLGFTLEGRLRRMVYTNGIFHDSLFYGMTMEEFQAKNQVS